MQHTEKERVANLLRQIGSTEQRTTQLQYDGVTFVLNDDGSVEVEGEILRPRADLGKKRGKYKTSKPA